MDDTKKINQPKTSDSSNNDYQKILDEAAASIKPEDAAPNIPTTLTEDEPVAKLEDIELNQDKPQLETPNIPSSSILDSNQDSKVEPPTEIKEGITTETPVSEELPKTPEEIKAQIDKIFTDESNQQNSSTSSTKKTNGFRNIFIIALIIFFTVVGAWIYFLFFRQTLNKSTLNTPTLSPIPTEIISNETCELNGEIYKVGESFKSADGCNTCGCQIGNIIACTEMACDISPAVISPATNSATSSSVPKDWKTYTDPTYKFSINYPSEWTTITSSPSKNFWGFQSPEGKKNEESSDLIMGDRPYDCGVYQIGCYKSFAEMVNEQERQETKINSLVGWLKTSIFKDFNQNKINGFTSYNVTQLGLSETKEFYIQNKDLSFCQITFCDRDLTSIEKQFLNSFKFN